jgi:hypothetical protein
MKRQGSTPGSRQPAISVRGASGDPARGSYCTPRYVASSLGPLDLDPFSNDRSHIPARVSLALERGEDGYGSGAPGTFLARSESLVDVRSCGFALVMQKTEIGYTMARGTHATRVWIQPDYSQVLRATRHYLHTRWIALLKWDLRPEWADLIGGASEWIGHLSNSPGRSSFEFEAPPGITGAGNSWPHALYARHYEDVTPAMRALCSYPDGTAHHHRKRSALDGPDARAWIQQWGLEPSLFNLSTPAQ